MATATPFFIKRLEARATGQRNKMDLGNLYLNFNVNPAGPTFNSSGQIGNITRPQISGFVRKQVSYSKQSLASMFTLTYDSTLKKTMLQNKDEIHFNWNPNKWTDIDGDGVGDHPLHWMIETYSGEVLFYGAIKTSQNEQVSAPPANNIICIPKGYIKIYL